MPYHKASNTEPPEAWPNASRTLEGELPSFSVDSMTNLSAQEITPAAVSSIYHLVQLCFPNRPDRAGALSALRQISRRSSEAVSVEPLGVTLFPLAGRFYGQASEVAGFWTLHREEGPDNIAWLGWLCVHPQLRGRGLGKAMLADAIQTARALAVGEIKLAVEREPASPAARHIYRTAGFQVVEELVIGTRPCKVLRLSLDM